MLLYQLNYGSIALTFLLFIILLIRKSYPTISRRLFKYMIAFCALSSAAEIVVVFMARGWISTTEVTREIIVISYWAIHITLHYIFLFYVVSTARGKLGNKAEKIIFSIIYGLSLAFLFSNPWHHLAFKVVDGYEYGPCAFVLELIGGLSLIYAAIITIRYRKILSKLTFGLDLFFLIIWAASVLVETFVKGLYIENFTITVTVLMVTIIADNPDKYFYAQTGVYNEETFNMVYGDKIKKNAPFKLVALSFEDFDLYIQKVGLKRANVAIFESLKHIRKDYGINNVFSLRRNVCVIDARIFASDEIMQKECERLAENCYRGGLERNPDLKLKAQFTVVSYPEDVQNLSDLHTAINLMLFDPDNREDELIAPFKTVLLDERHRREKIVLKIHDAIEHDGFEMYYQPLYDWKKDRYIGLEALIRFKDDGGERYSPGEFIPIAEEDGLIFDIDEIVFEKVCRFIRNSNLKNYGVNFVDINLSLLKLLDPSTVDRYKELAARYEIDPSFINLEITETAEGDGKYLNIVRNNIAKFRENGFSFSLDDYGSGYSTVVYMAEMDVKIVKIDASILWNAMTNKKYYTVLENCVRLIYCFDKECVCEGVEDEKQVTILRRLGVDFFQGFYYSKPVTESEILPMLERKNKIGGGSLKSSSRFNRYKN